MYAVRRSEPKSAWRTSAAAGSGKNATPAPKKKTKIRVYFAVVFKVFQNEFTLSNNFLLKIRTKKNENNIIIINKYKMYYTATTVNEVNRKINRR